MYYDGHNGMVWANFMAYLNTPEGVEGTHPMEQFYHDAATGNLPTYSFIEPRVFLNTSNTGPSRGLPNHQHPVSSVREGERLYKNIYEALRQGPAWNHTLFVLTYDEHGGFYDHVHPPTEGIPHPGDGINAKDPTGKYNYNRLGIRIPTLLISPWIAKKGTLIHEPQIHQKPTSTSQWELSSIPATMKKLFNLNGYLTKRDAWAATFEDLLLDNDLTEPRQDCPLTLPDVPPSTVKDVEYFRKQPLDDHQQRVIDNLCHLNGLVGEDDSTTNCGSHLVQSQEEASELTAALWQSFRYGIPLPSGLLAKKEEKPTAATAMTVAVE